MLLYCVPIDEVCAAVTRFWFDTLFTFFLSYLRWCQISNANLRKMRLSCLLVLWTHNKGYLSVCVCDINFLWVINKKQTCCSIPLPKQNISYDDRYYLKVCLNLLLFRCVQILYIWLKILTQRNRGYNKFAICVHLIYFIECTLFITLQV